MELLRMSHITSPTQPRPLAGFVVWYDRRPLIEIDHCGERLGPIRMTSFRRSSSGIIPRRVWNRALEHQAPSKPMTFSIGPEVNDERTRHVGTGDFHIRNKQRSIRHHDNAGVQHGAALSNGRSRTRESNEPCGYSGRR